PPVIDAGGRAEPVQVRDSEVDHGPVVPEEGVPIRLADNLTRVVDAGSIAVPFPARKCAQTGHGPVLVQKSKVTRGADDLATVVDRSGDGPFRLARERSEVCHVAVLIEKGVANAIRRGRDANDLPAVIDSAGRAGQAT